MFEFFDWVVNLVTSLVGFVFQMINGLLRLLSILPTAVLQLTNSVSYLPSILVGFATITATICVIYVIVGRNSGGKTNAVR